MSKVWCEMCGDGWINEALGMCLECLYSYSRAEYIELGGSAAEWDHWQSEAEDN